ncbi:hypothetical protein [Halobacillus mangrovi]|uniref:hypothetical protein n=1 Tax=Halobacillus mangrovi TaxID=402384 RepID=UPI003D95A795
MDLINLYVYEVTRRLPEKIQDDIALELKSTIHDMLPDDGYNEKDVKQVLETLGNPATLASRYKDSPSHLIGGPFYESYLSVLKITLPIALTVALISLIAAEIVSYDGQENLIGTLLTISGKAISAAIEVAIQTFFWITITFIVIERTVSSDKLPETPFGKKWIPEQLKVTAVIPKKQAISRWEIFFGLLWTAIWATVYFKASHLIAIYMFNDQEGIRQTIPLFNEDVLLSYWPIVVLLLGVEITLSISKWLTRQWTNKLAVANLLSNLLFVGVLCLMVTNNALFSTDAMAFMSENLNNHTERILQWAKLTLILTFLVITGIDSFEGFRKANKGIDLNKKLDMSKP